MSGREHTLQLDVARRLVAYADEGLPIVLIGDWSDAHVPSMPAAADDDTRLRELLTELRKRPTVHTVADRPDVPEAIEALGLRRDVEYAQTSMLLHAHRRDDEADYFFFANDAVSKKGSTGSRIRHDVILTGHVRGAVPHLLDPWTGTVAPLAAYTRTEDGRIRLTVDLAPGAVSVVRLSRPSGGIATRHVTATSADEVVTTDGRTFEVRAATAGSFRTTFDNGRSVDAVVRTVPAPFALESWKLDVEDWRPGADATETVRMRHELSLAEGLLPWSQVPGLEDVSGVGTYRATFTLGREWNGATGARLELGEVCDTFRVRLDGHALAPVDQVTRVVDLGRRLRRGSHTLEVEVATTLLNRLRVTNAPVFGAAKRQAYGLLGPVRVVPYGTATVRA
ncbi:hypothetical protein [Streptomyces sp. NPDC002690]